MNAFEFPASDDLNDTFNAPVDHARQAQAAAATEAKVGFVEKCPKCRGTGRFTSYSGRSLGACFACKGKGQNTFKTSTATRARNRETAAARHQAKIEAFKAAHPAIWTWMSGNAFEFAVKMLGALTQYGYLTENQIAACSRCIEKRAAAVTEAQQARQERLASAPAIDVAPIIAAFSVARSHILNPVIKLADLKISYAPSTGKNPGALYVRQGGEYAGMIKDGKFLAGRDCSESLKDRILATCADPKTAAIAYGKEYGVCACCNRTLTDPVSIANGIGPICASNFGW